MRGVDVVHQHHVAGTPRECHGDLLHDIKHRLDISRIEGFAVAEGGLHGAQAAGRVILLVQVVALLADVARDHGLGVGLVEPDFFPRHRMRDEA